MIWSGIMDISSSTNATTFPAASFECVVRQVKSRFVIGPVCHSRSKRRPSSDHLHAVRSCSTSGRCQEAGGRTTVCALRPCPSDGLSFASNPRRRFASPVSSPVFRTYCGFVARNRLVCDDAFEAVLEGRSPLVLTERNEHLDALQERLPTGVQHSDCPARRQAWVGKKSRDQLPPSWQRFPNSNHASCWQQDGIYRRRLRRCTPGYAVSRPAGFVARHTCAICGTFAPIAR